MTVNILTSIYTTGQNWSNSPVPYWLVPSQILFQQIQTSSTRLSVPAFPSSPLT